MTSMRRAARTAIADSLRSAAFARAYTVTALGAGLLTAAIDRVNGPVTLATIVTGLAVLGGAALFARRDELSLVGFAPTSLVAFLAWAAASAVWAIDGAHARAVAAWLSLAAWALIGATIAHLRDTLQIARAAGDVFRALLALSLALEVLFGILLDQPLGRLGIAGDLAYGGPIQGLFVTRNLLGFVAVLALVTFAIEWRARAVARPVAVASLVLAGLMTVLSGSPVAFVLSATLVLAELALALARRAPRGRRARVHLTLAGGALVLVALAFWFRHAIIRFFAARSGFAARADLWNALIDWVRHKPVTGWGLFGSWQGEPFPTNILAVELGGAHGSALSAYFDVLLQLGWVGLLLFLLVGLFALGRAWLAAADRRSVVYAWLPLVLVAILVESVFESYALHDIGWLLLVVCAVRAGRERSWRARLDPAAPVPSPLRPQGNAGRAG
ncbi:O-antigen ligase family protein [Microbacterium sp. ZXX196]|uniref:O-antigen ligase family protein n=1 Tax=Microbacterium sp. ZXX196 TaxID=2609291 RepID=UPI001E5513B9|nr:O-antigen ligase family protein [Microbacterium sp. ZXX196]